MTYQLIFKKTAASFQHGRFSSLLRITAIVVVVGLGLGAYRLYVYIWPTPFKASQDSFQIVFPASPTVSKLAARKDQAGLEESGRIYDVQNQAKGTDYAVYVTTYPGLSFTALPKAATTTTLQSEIETLAQNDKDTLGNGQTIAFKGLAAVEATLTPSNPSESSTNCLAFLSQDRMYVIFGGGISRSKFDSFAKTFNFIN